MGCLNNVGTCMMSLIDECREESAEAERSLLKQRGVC